MVSSDPIFVVGAPRSGTTLMKEILNRHPDVHLFNEVHFFERVWDRRAELGDLADPENRARVIADMRALLEAHGTDGSVAARLPADRFTSLWEAHGDGYSGLLRTMLVAAAEQHGATRWGDSSPQDVLYLRTLFAWYPGARVIGLVRDPRAFLASYKNYYRRAEPSYRERYNPLTNALLWRGYMTALEEARRLPFGSNVRVQTYEGLVAAPEASLRELCRHVGIEFCPSMLEIQRGNSSYTAGGQSDGIFTSSMDRWRRELTPTEQWTLERVCGPVMRHFGYKPELSEQLSPPSWVELSKILSMAPARLFNSAFRGRKPFRLVKLARMFSLLRAPVR